MIAKPKRAAIPLAIAALIVTGCGGWKRSTVPLRLTPESLQNRALQTRQYEGVSEADLFSAATGVVQDLGFIIIESETNLGLIVCAKMRDAERSYFEQAPRAMAWGLLMFPVLFYTAISGQKDILDWMREIDDDRQKLWAHVVIRPVSEEGKTHDVRVTFQRYVWNDKGQLIRIQSLDEPEYYQEFFDLFSKSVFLEGREI